MKALRGGAGAGCAAVRLFRQSLPTFRQLGTQHMHLRKQSQYGLVLGVIDEALKLECDLLLLRSSWR